MRDIKQAIPWKRLICLEIVVGLALLLITFAVTAKADIDKAEDKLVASVEYIREQCNNSQIRDEASESKSLLRVTESTDDVSRRLKFDRLTVGDAFANEELLKKCAKDSYLDGLIVLDEAGNVEESFDLIGMQPADILERMGIQFILDINSFPEKKYAARLQGNGGDHVDAAAVKRIDAPGMLVGYFSTPSEYANVINNQAQTLVSGYILEEAGVIAIGNEEGILATNKEDLLGKRGDDVNIISKLRESKAHKKLLIAKEPGTLLSYRFGVMDKSQEYYIYGFMNERDVFPSMVYIMLCVLSLYIVMIFAINILLKQTEKTYQKEQQESQQRYLNSLEIKNRELKAAVVRAETASAAKSSFLSRMSHDIRTPLNGIIGLLKIDETHLLDHNLIQENHRKMTVAANHLLSLLNDVLQMSKLEDGMVELAHELISLKQLSSDIATIIRVRVAEAGLSWEYVPDNNPMPYAYVYGSPVHLRQIFLNIYSNCIKYTPKGGRITTKLECLGGRDGVCKYRWTISDTGKGMTPEFLEKIFEPFSQEQNDARSTYKGVGLGMSIVKNLLTRMDGTIEVKSTVGKGSTFIITIPFEIAEAPKDAQPAKEAEAATVNAAAEADEANKENPASEADEPKQPAKDIADMNLLIAEDNELNADIIRMILEDKGTSLKIVPDGSKAVEEFNSNPPGTYDAILMDVMMPVMNGLDATKAIRALPRKDSKEIPIIAMTANAFAEDCHNCLEAGMNYYLTKPLDVAKLMEVLAKIG